ncbi:hypothetical protein D6745_01910 [Candidatus Woesearchaeota archaeon]|nr:MAG: hypothetical protein D6745_01910 [Candidatus Woesearchaeota archaeon]
MKRVQGFWERNPPTYDGLVEKLLDLRDKVARLESLKTVQQKLRKWEDEKRIAEKQPELRADEEPPQISSQLTEIIVEALELPYTNVCPLDYRYYDPELSPVLSEWNFVKSCGIIHRALMLGLARFGRADETHVKEVEEAVERMLVHRVYDLERNVTHHDQNAVIRELSELVSADTARRLHPGTTSYDIIEPAKAMIFREAINDYFVPKMKELLTLLVDKAEEYSDRIQVGRTHGQWTSPTSFGFYIVTQARRLATQIDKLSEAIDNLEGKIAGIVGTRASIARILGGNEEAIEFERYVLEDIIGIRQCEASSQVTGKESLADLTNTIVNVATILGKLGNDLRHLQRSEIAEVGEHYAADTQVGSSADPNKQNPITAEQTAGLVPLIIGGQTAVYSLNDTDHQRDLRNSVIYRFEPTHMILMAYQQVKNMIKIFSKLSVHESNMDRHLKESGIYSIAECLNAVLKAYGFMNSHEYVRNLSVKAKKEGVPLLDVALADENINLLWKHKFTPEDRANLRDIQRYTGTAIEETRRIAEELRERYLGGAK